MAINVLFDITRLAARHDAACPTGIDRVDLRYLRHFWEEPTYNVCCVYQHSGCFSVLTDDEAKLFIQGLHGQWNLGRRPEERLRTLGHRLKSGADIKREPDRATGTTPRLRHLVRNRPKGSAPIYVNASHHGVGKNQFVASLKSAAGGKAAYFLHDMIPVDFPEFVREEDDRKHSERVEAMLLLGDLLIVNSEYTRSRLAAFAGQRPQRAHPDVAMFPIGLEETVLKSKKIPSALAKKMEVSGSRPFFSYVSTIEPRKNHLLLLNIWRDLLTSMGDRTPYLVLVGRRGWNNQTVFDYLDRSPRLKDRVVELAGLTDEEMSGLVENSSAALFPSFVEGWGMPVVEALAVGTPVIASDIPVFREHAAGQATLLSPIDGLGWTAAIQEAATSSLRVTDYHPPTWKKHFEQLDPLMQELGESRADEPGDSDEFSDTWQSQIRSSTPSSAPPPQAQAQPTGMTSTERKVLKLLRDPQTFLSDSKHFPLKVLGSIGKSRRRKDK